MVNVLPSYSSPIDAAEFLEYHRRGTAQPLFNALNDRYIVNANCVLVCRFCRLSIAATPQRGNQDADQAEPEPSILYFWSSGQSYTTNFDEWWSTHIGKILFRMDSFQELGSALEFERVISPTYRTSSSNANQFGVPRSMIPVY